MGNINLDEARAFISGVDQKIRNLELEKVKLEQQKEYTQKSLEENVKKMEEYGCTPETIDSEIEKLSQTALALRGKIETILDGAHNE